MQYGQPSQGREYAATGVEGFCSLQAYLGKRLEYAEPGAGARVFFTSAPFSVTELHSLHEESCIKGEV